MFCGWLGGECEIGLGDCTKSREAESWREKRRNQGWESRERKKSKKERKH